MSDYFQIVRRDGPEAVSKLRALEDINILNEDNENLLHVAIAYKNDSVAHEVVKRGIDVNQRSVKGLTPLHYAVIYNNRDITNFILENGGDVTLVDMHGNSPLWTAVLGARGKYDLVELLLSHGGFAVTNLRNKHGRSPVDFAEQTGKSHLLKILTE